MSERVAYLSLGSNIGDRLAELQEAIRRLGAAPGVNILRVSKVYETEPVGKTDQPPFLNVVVEARTELEAHDLLDTALEIENAMGRIRTERWGPRVIDIDLLLLGSIRIEGDDRLTLPHPRMHERAFVLVPLSELAPDLRPPGFEESVEQLKRSVQEQIVIPYGR